MAYLYQILCNGLHNGAIYAVLAYSYVLLHQVVPKPNLAHGAFFAMSGQIFILAANFAYNALIFNFTASFAFGLGVSFVLCALAVSVMAAKIVPRFLEQSPNMMIVATLALAIVLMEAFRIGADGRDYWLPPYDWGNVDFGLGASITAVQAMNLLIMAVLLVACELVLQRTMAGRAIRSVAQDGLAASLMGINVNKTVILTAGAASALACCAGFLAVLHFGNMSFGAGLTYGLKVLFIASAGRFSTPRMAALAAFLFCESEALWDGYLPVLWREAFFFSGLAAMLMLKGRQQN